MDSIYKILESLDKVSENKESGVKITNIQWKDSGAKLPSSLKLNITAPSGSSNEQIYDRIHNELKDEYGEADDFDFQFEESVEEGRYDGPNSSCCDAPLLNYNDGLGICSDCKEWSGPHEDEEELEEGQHDGKSREELMKMKAKAEADIKNMQSSGDGSQEKFYDETQMMMAQKYLDDINNALAKMGESVEEAEITPIDHSDDEDGASADDIASAITRRMMAHPKFGALVREIDIIDLNDAIEDIAQFHKGGDLGTSDVSNMVNDVLKQLGKPDALKEEEAVTLDQAREYFFDKHDFADENIQGEYEKMASKMSSKDAMTLKKELEEFYPDALNEEDIEEGNDFTKARLDAIKAGKDSFEVDGKTYKVTGDTSDEEAMTEDYDKDEYDEEGEMVKSQARTIEDAAKELQEILDDDENLPEWVQKKVTLAKEYIDTARDYMKANPDEEESEENPEELDEEAVSRDQQEAAGAALSAKRGETLVSKLVGASKEMYDSMTEKELEDFAGTKHKGLPEKVKKKKTEETTVAGSVAPGGDAAGKSIYGNPSIYESFNNRVESMITESMSVNVSSSTEGEPTVSVSATGEDANMLAQLLQLAAVPRAQGAPCEVCGQVHEGGCMREGEDDMANNPNEKTYDMQYLLNAISGGLNGQKRQINPNNPGDNPLAMTGIKNNTVNIEESEDVSASHLETLYKEFKAK